MVLQVKGNAEEFVMYALLHAAAASPKQLAIDMRDVPRDLWQHPFLQHALQVTCLEGSCIDAGRLHKRTLHTQISRTMP